MRTRALTTAILAITALFAAEADCQIVYNQPGSSALRFHYNTWSLDPSSDPEEEIAQLTFGVSGFLPIRDNFEARYQIASGYNDYRLDDARSAVRGLSDLRLQLARSFSNDRLLLSAGLNLPTGKQELDLDGERRIIEFLSRDYVSTPLRRYGEGFGFNLQAGGAAELGDVTCGMSAVYDYTGSYTPYEGVGDYDPGDVFSMTATAAVTAGRINLAGDAGFSLFGTDALEDADIYKQAPCFTARIQAVLPGDRYSATVGTMMILRGRNKRFSLADGAIDSQLKKYGDEFDVFLRVAFAVKERWNLGAMIGTKQILSSEEYLGRSSVQNFAVDLARSLSDHVSLNAGIMYHVGSVDDGAADISGFQASGALSVSY